MINQRYRGQTTRIVSNNGTFFPQLLLDPKDYRSWISFYRAMSNTQDMLPQLQQVKFCSEERAERFLEQFKQGKFAIIDFSDWVLTEEMFLYLFRDWHFELMHWISSGDLSLQELQQVRKWLHQYGTLHGVNFQAAFEAADEYHRPTIPVPAPPLAQQSISDLLTAHSRASMALVCEKPAGNENYLLSIEQEIVKRTTPRMPEYANSALYLPLLVEASASPQGFEARARTCHGLEGVSEWETSDTSGTLHTALSRALHKMADLVQQQGPKDPSENPHDRS
jgi:hypothetical protein